MIEFVFEIGINLLETFIIFDFLTKYLESKYRGITKKNWICTRLVPGICPVMYNELHN